MSGELYIYISANPIPAVNFHVPSLTLRADCSGSERLKIRLQGIVVSVGKVSPLDLRSSRRLAWVLAGGGSRHVKSFSELGMLARYCPSLRVCLEQQGFAASSRGCVSDVQSDLSISVGRVKFDIHRSDEYVPAIISSGQWTANYKENFVSFRVVTLSHW